MTDRYYTLGTTSITRVPEKLFDDFSPNALLPLWNNETVETHRPWLGPDNLDA
ncbi:hypothetical protein PMI35_00298, partial [Pseudomonas sp. GM78]